MEDRPSARQYYSSIRGEVELERFQELIGEEPDKDLVYIQDKKNSIVTVYKNNSENAKPFWDVAFLFTFVLMVFTTCYSFHDSFIWDSIGYDFAVAALLLAAVIWYVIRRIFYRSVKLEKLREIELDSKKAKDHITSIRVFKVACAIFILFGFFFLAFLKTYSLTYLRYLAEGGYAATAIQGEINNLEFDDRTERITGKLEGTQGGYEDIELFLQIDRCPDEVSIYINGEEPDTDWLECYRQPGGLLEESYFTNIIRAALKYKAEDLNTLEVRAGSLHKIWALALNE